MAIIPRRQPLVNPNQRQLDSRTYNEAVNRMKGMQQGTDLYNKNLNTVQTLGKQHGWNYQQYGAPRTNTTNPAPTGGTPPATGGTTTQPPASSWMSLDRANAATKYNEAKNRISSGRLKPGTPEYDNNMKILSELGGKFGWKYQPTVGDWKPPAAPGDTTAPGGDTTAPGGNTTAPGGNTAPPAPGDQPPAPEVPAPTVPPGDTSGTSPMTKAIMDMLMGGMSTTRAYEPQNFEGSPLYQFQKQKGMQDLEKLMAARGLTNSGAEIQANSDFLAQLGATEAEKQRGYAQGDMDRTMGGMFNLAGLDRADRQMNWDQNNINLDRLNRMREFEAGRSDAAQGRTQNFLTQLLAFQAQNPIADQAYKGTQDATQLTKALQDSLAAFTADNYNRRVPSGGGGGGTPPPANPGSGPNLDIINMILNHGNKADNQGIIGTILGAISR
jgi:hypothetical protein